MQRTLTASHGSSHTMGDKTKGSAQRKMKAKAKGRKGKGGYNKDRRCFLSNKAPPISMLTGLALYRVDNGSLICRQCHEGKTHKKGHHRTCPKSTQYDGLAATRKTTKSGGANPFSAAEKMTRITKPRHKDVIRFVTGLEHQAKARAAKAARLSTAAKVTLPSGFKFQPPAFWEYYDYSMRVAYWKAKMAEANTAITGGGAGSLSPPGTYRLMYFYDIV